MYGSADSTRTGRESLTVKGILKESLLVLAALGVYHVVRVLVGGAGVEPLENSLALLRLETVLGLDWESSLQQAFLDHLRPLISVLNFVYVWGYWLVLAGSLGYLYIRRRDTYRRVRNAMIVSGLIGVFVFAGFPVAPPRLAPVGIVDTVELGDSIAEEVARPNWLINKNAAMPSFHFGWILLCGIGLATTMKRRIGRALAFSLPVLMGLTIIVTGNHYVIDAIVGGLVCLLALVPWTLPRRRAEREPRELQGV
jgi:hypothetical protein